MKRRILLAATLLPLLGLVYADESTDAKKPASTDKDFEVSSNLKLYSKVGYNVNKPNATEGTNPTGSYSIFSASVSAKEKLRKVAEVGYDLTFNGQLKFAFLVADNSPQFSNDKKSIYAGNFVGTGSDNHYYGFTMLNLDYKKTLENGNKLSATAGRFYPSTKFVQNRVEGAQVTYDTEKYKIYALATLQGFNLADPKTFANKTTFQQLATIVPKMYALEATRRFSDKFSVDAIAYYKNKDYFAVGAGLNYKKDLDIYATKTELFFTDLTYSEPGQALDGLAYTPSGNTLALKETVRVKEGPVKDLETVVRIYKNFSSPNRSFSAGDFKPSQSNSSSDFDAVPNYATSRDGLGLSADATYKYGEINYGVGFGVASALWGVTRAANVSAEYEVDKFKVSLVYTIKSEITYSGYPVYNKGPKLSKRVAQGRNTLESTVSYNF